MRVLLTGALGNIGSHTTRALLMEGHRVRAFDVPTRANRRRAGRIKRKMGDRIEFVWGDLRRPEDCAAAVRDMNAVVHLAFIVPKQSCTKLDIERDPSGAREINVGGTRNLLEAAGALEHPPRFVFASSVAVYGPTGHLDPPRRAGEPLHPVDAYGRHKMVCEHMVQRSGLRWTILRLGAAMPMRLTRLHAMFDLPLDTRIEFIDPRDAATAFAGAISAPDAANRILLLGGGRGCRYIYRDLLGVLLGACGVSGTPPEAAFTRKPFYTDWLDTDESERVLHYQRHDLTDYAEIVRRTLGPTYWLARVAGSLPLRWLVARSPYLSASTKRVRAASSAGP